MEKNRGEKGRFTGDDTMSPPADNPTYAELGIHPKQASREQLVKRAFDEEEILDICAELIDQSRTE